MEKNKVPQDRYVTILPFMVNNLHLSGNELITYAVVYGFCNYGDAWFHGSASLIASWCQCSRKTVFSNFKKLCEKGLLEKRLVMGEKGWAANYRPTYRPGEQVGVEKKLPQGGEETSLPQCNNFPTTREETSPNNIKRYNTEITRESACEEPGSENQIKAKPKKHRHGEFGHVLLTDEEFDTLDGKVGGYRDAYIRIVDEYCEQSGRSYKNYSLAIQNFYRRDLESNRLPRVPVARKAMTFGDAFAAQRRQPCTTQ